MTTENIRPMPGRVLIRPELDPEMTKSGLHKPHSGRARAAVILGTVVAVGPGKFVCHKGHVHRVDSGLEVGQRVMFSRIDGQRVDIDEIEYRAMDQSEVMCVLGGELHGIDVDDLRVAT